MSTNCGKCNKDTENSDSVECDTCLKWFHRTCTNLTVEKLAAIQTLGSDGHWYCTDCKDKISSSTSKRKVKIGNKLLDNPYTKEFFTLGDDECNEEISRKEDSMPHKLEVPSSKSKVPSTISKVFTCQHCTKVFQTNSGLWKHLQQKHAYVRETLRRNLKKSEHCSEDGTSYYSFKKHLEKDHNIVAAAFMCEHCNKHFSSSSNLRRHIKTKHAIKKCSNTLQCDICENMYKTKRSLIQHQYDMHNIVKNAKMFSCTLCDKTFKLKRLLNSHKIAEHPQTRKNFSLKCVHEDCKQEFFNVTKMVEHLIADHRVSINKMQKQFASWEDFHIWKLKEEESTFTFFAKSSQKTGKQRKDGKKIFYYSCNRHGSSRAHVKTGELPRLTNRKNLKGRVKTDSVCTASMKAVGKEGNVYVTYVNTHCHPISEKDIEHQPIPLPTWEKIKSMLLIGKQPEEIVNELQSSFGTLENRSENVAVTKTSSIKRNTIVTFKRRLGLSAEKVRKRHANDGVIRRRLHADDTVSTKMLIEKLRKNENDPVILYKPLGSNIIVGNINMASLSEFNNLFLLGLQSKEQLDMLKSNGNKIICVDAISISNANGYQLFNVIVKDEFDKGYVVASLIASSINEHILYYFFVEIKNRHPNLNISLVMSDDDMGGYACKWVFGENILALLFPWHLKQAWKRNLPKDSNTNSMYEHLILMMYEKRQRTFHELWEKFKRKYESYENFINYFANKYMNRVHVWAAAYRNFPHADTYTSTRFEEYNSRIKKQYIKKLPNKRIDDLISISLRIERDDYCRHYWDFKKRHLECDQKTEIQEQHDKGMSIPDQNIDQHSPTQWIITSNVSSSIIHEVEMLRENCVASCSNRCDTLPCQNLCYHLYHCTCSDDIQLCEHTHKIHSLLHKSKPIVAMSNQEPSIQNNQTTVYTTTATPSEESHEHKRMEKISQLKKVLNALSSLIESEDVYDAHYNNISENISNIVRQCRNTESVDGNSPLKSVKHGRIERSRKKIRRKPQPPIVQKNPDPIAEVQDEITIEIEPDVESYNQLNYTIHEEVKSSNEHEYASFFDNDPN